MSESKFRPPDAAQFQVHPTPEVGQLRFEVLECARLISTSGIILPSPAESLDSYERFTDALKNVPRRNGRFDFLARAINSTYFDDQSGCWISTQKNRNKGYATISDPFKRSGYQHLEVYKALYDLNTDSNRQIDHLCRRRDCCFPGHLEAVSRVENIRRMFLSRNHERKIEHGFHPMFSPFPVTGEMSNKLRIITKRHVSVVEVEKFTFTNGDDREKAFVRFEDLESSPWKDQGVPVWVTEPVEVAEL